MASVLDFQMEVRGSNLRQNKKAISRFLVFYRPLTNSALKLGHEPHVFEGKSRR